MPAAPMRTPPTTRADEPTAAVSVRVRAEQRHHVVVDERLLRLVGVAPDEDDHPGSQEGRPAEEADEGHVQRARHELHRDEERDQDGGDQADPAPVVDGAGVDVGALALHRDEQPRHGVDQHHHPAADGEEHEPDADPHGVDARRARHRAAHATQHPVVGAPPQRAHPPAEVVVVAVLVPLRPGSGAAGPGATGPDPAPVGWAPRRGRVGRRRGRAATLGERTRTGIGCLCDTSMIARRHHRDHQGHP